MTNKLTTSFLLFVFVVLIHQLVLLTHTVDAFTTTTTTKTVSSSSQKRIQQQQQQLLPYLFSTVESNDVVAIEEEEDDIITIKNELKKLLTGISVVSTPNDDDTDAILQQQQQQQQAETFYIDPITKEPFAYKVVQPSQNIILGDTTSNVQQRTITYKFVSSSNQNTYTGTSDTYINLLQPTKTGDTSNDDDEEEEDNTTRIRNAVQETVTKLIVPFVPPPLRSSLVQITSSVTGSNSSSSTETTDEYIPMRDLFTSPFVSYAYERGWREGFQRAGFPGVETEAIMALDYFYPPLQRNMNNSNTSVLLDMSCATGLFTRKFIQRAVSTATTNDTTYPTISRIIGADYSDAMLREARNRFQQDPTIQNVINRNSMIGQATNDQYKYPQIELIRCDVGCIPIQNDSVPAVHAGAAMHCWPDLPLALSEIYRILQPNGGRYFATTFLSNYFSTLQRTDPNNGNNNNNVFQPTQQTFQYFSSKEQLRQLLINAGYAPQKVQIDVIGTACVVIKCEK